jgi:iron(III) transport system ATP-binding protein
MTVRQNVAFPLKIRNVRTRELGERVEQSLALVEMQSFANRYPHELSGGQQQRVALARTLVYRPSLLLLDEPLSNLDAKLRLRARGWLKQLQSQLGLTTIFVTHDQTEALSLSDRIVVMDGGRIMQVGTPQDVYREPATAFIADFIGGSNFLDATVVAVGEGRALISLPDGQTLSVAAGPELIRGRQVTVSVRPESVCLARAGNEPDSKVNLLRGRIVEREYLGPRYQYAVAIADQLVRFEAVETLANDDATITVPAASCTVFAFRGAA